MMAVWKSVCRLAPLIPLTGSIALAAFLSTLPFFVTLEHKTIDWRIRYRNPDRSFGQGVAVVFVDEETVKEYIYRSPLSRTMLARLIDTLSAADVKLIGLDVILDAPTTAEDDDRLADAIRRSGRTVIVSNLKPANGTNALVRPMPKFLDAALTTGLASFPPDPIDNRIRHARIRYDAIAIPSLSAVLHLLAGGAALDPTSRLVAPAALNSIKLPTDREGRFFINYQRPSSQGGDTGNIMPTYSAWAVLQGYVPADWLKGKVVLVGAGYDDKTDVFQTPFYTARNDYLLIPGVEIHATALATLNQNRTIEVPSTATSLALLCVLCLILTGIECRLNTGVAGVILVLMMAGNAVADLSVFDRANLALPLVSTTMGLFFTFVSLAVYRSLTEGREKRWIRRAFEMYVAPSIVKELVRQPERLFLGGEERELTILFTDIEGFTTISESMRPTELVSLLNEYLDGMTRIVVANGGTLDKYEGDAIMAFWGAPIEQPDHALRAAKAAVEMAKFSKEISARFQADKKPAISTRIGINTGPVVVGNIGSKKHFNYTVMGDHANLASRLEGANKFFKTHTMISEATYAQTKNQLLARELGTIRTKGKAHYTRVYELVGFMTEQYPASLTAMLAAYNRAMEQYRLGNWEAALELFTRAGNELPDDEPVAIYRIRCAALLGQPPDADATFVLETK